jgi:hypothetical protein
VEGIYGEVLLEKGSGIMKPVKFYEITEKEGQDAVWGGASATEAVEWFRRGLDRRVFVSIWNEEDPEEPVLMVDKIEVSTLILATIISERGRA